MPHDHIEEQNIPASLVEEAEIRAEADTALEGAIEKVEEDVVTGAWTALTLGAKVAEESGKQTARVRSESSSARAFLRGELKIKAEEDLAIGETLFTVPAGLRPPGLVELKAQTISGTSSFNLKIASTGVATLGTELKATQNINLDGLGWNLT